MALKKISVLVLLISLSASVFGQEFQKQFRMLTAKKDTAGQRNLLKDWFGKDPNNPDLYMAYFNFYIAKAQNGNPEMQKSHGGKESMMLTDSNMHEPNKAALVLEPEHFKIAIDYIDKGIAEHPDRLDLRFGKTTLMGEINNYYQYQVEIVKTIEQSVKNKNAWLWANNVNQASPADFMLTSIQSYLQQLYNIGTPERMKELKKISETVMKYYPKYAESLVNIGVYYYENKEYDKAQSYFLRAEYIAPDDVVVQNNIAQTSKQMGDSKKAIEYFEKVLKQNDAEALANARKQLAVLKAK